MSEFVVVEGELVPIDTAGNPLPIANGGTIGSTPGLMVAGKEGTAARFLEMSTVSGAKALKVDVVQSVAVDVGIDDWLGSTAPTVGQKTMADSLPVTLASNQPAILITGTITALPPSSSAALATIAVGTVGTSGSAPASTVTTGTLVYKTDYVEPTSAAQRSIRSDNAADTSAGTGARTVRVTYYDNTTAGPFTETVTLAGTTWVNTVATNIRYVEKIEVLTTGTDGWNVGIITLRTGTGGGGTDIGTIAANDNQTFWCHHYVPTGMTCFVTSATVGNNATSATNGGFFFIKSRILPPTATLVTKGVVASDIIRAYGQTSTIQRVYDSSIRVTGPAQLVMHVVHEAASAVQHRASFDFYEEAS